MMCQRIGWWPIFTMGLGRYSVSSRRRVPSPPARITTGIGSTPRVTRADYSRFGFSPAEPPGRIEDLVGKIPASLGELFLRTLQGRAPPCAQDFSELLGRFCPDHQGGAEVAPCIDQKDFLQRSRASKEMPADLPDRLEQARQPAWQLRLGKERCALQEYAPHEDFLSQAPGPLEESLTGKALVEKTGRDLQDVHLGVLQVLQSEGGGFRGYADRGDPPGVLPPAQNVPQRGMVPMPGAMDEQRLQALDAQRGQARGEACFGAPPHLRFGRVSIEEIGGKLGDDPPALVAPEQLPDHLLASVGPRGIEGGHAVRLSGLQHPGQLFPAGWAAPVGNAVRATPLRRPERESRGRPHQAVQPPSTTRFCPDTKLEAGLSRKTTAQATSSGSPRRPSGTRAVSSRTKPRFRLTTGEGTGPGETAFIRTPCFPRWHAA